MPSHLRPPSRLSATDAAKFGLHVALLFVAFLAAYEMRRALPISWWLTHSDALRVIGWAALYAAIGGGVELVLKTERSAWRFSSLGDLVVLARSLVIGMGLFLLSVFVLDRGLQLPRSVLVLTLVFSLAGLGGLRLSWRLAHDPRVLGRLGGSLHQALSQPSLRDQKPMLVVGELASADAHLRHLLSDATSPYRPVGIISPHAAEVGLRLHGVPVLGAIGHWKLPQGSAETPRYAILFLDDPVQAWGVSPLRIGEVRREGHTLLRPRRLVDLATPDADPHALKEIPLEEFLPRSPIQLNPSQVQTLIRGKRVLVTGAGGSIGSEICRQLQGLDCAHLTLVDHSEFLLFEIDRELANADALASRRAVLANVRNEQRIRDLFMEERPDIVFHAAALKHVTLVEQNPSEGVLTNVLGTWNVIQAAIAAEAAQFVLVSTDKAVAPTNVMGATKRIAESLLEIAPPSSTRLSAVRFGNVLGSAGSVVPIFQKQIAQGGPVTVTHPDVDRYFMTIPEAVQLVLHSTAINAARPQSTPSKFLLEMGKPVKIVDLARQMIELTGQVPDVDIKIEFTGLKPGEKLSEALYDSDEIVSDCAHGIMEVRPATAPITTPTSITALIKLARESDPQTVAASVNCMLTASRQPPAASSPNAKATVGHTA
ncbi:O-antigen biosynthesis protein WbqV [Brevundimonas bullata]|uniref:O-antigen biosynthesis protein WbqV n=1 Tax=Brevundimonas bullata TaxID=13160 RepID=A0A7W7N3D3_9CAUL|nr:nucleoside-diphosphate sugar epimerase/dehydratase [Brevundimonas bullata]MBB4798273.1 O-antigen biosynthesis protein WbqV [Brevundimonas bullata]MBB6383413.1 O-antigen biosynthesis protein WbqV [Brevundimonas bullata]